VLQAFNIWLWQEFTPAVKEFADLNIGVIGTGEIVENGLSYLLKEIRTERKVQRVLIYPLD